MLVYVVLLNVAVAVLLEGFLSSMTENDMELKAQLGTLEYSKISGSLDPLIASFSSFDSADQLRQMIGNLFKHLDGNSSNSVSFLEFKEGLEALDIQPALHIAEEDWDQFTDHGKFLDDNGALDDERFQRCMHEELKIYSQRIISHQMRQAMAYGKENALDYFAHKMQMVEVFTVSKRLSDLIRDLNEHGVSHNVTSSYTVSPSNHGSGGNTKLHAAAGSEAGFLHCTHTAKSDWLVHVSGLASPAENSREGEWKEVRDLLQQLAAEQRELRVGVNVLREGQQELRLGQQRLELTIGAKGGTGSSGILTHAQSPELMSASSIPAANEQQENVAHKSAANEQQESVAHNPDAEEEKFSSQNVGFTYAEAARGRRRADSANDEMQRDMKQKTTTELLRERLLAQQEAFDAAMAALRVSACEEFGHFEDVPRRTESAINLSSSPKPRGTEFNKLLEHLGCELTKLRETRDQLVGVKRAQLSPSKVVCVCVCMCVCVCESVTDWVSE